MQAHRRVADLSIGTFLKNSTVTFEKNRNFSAKCKNFTKASQKKQQKRMSYIFIIAVFQTGPNTSQK